MNPHSSCLTCPFFWPQTRCKGVDKYFVILLLGPSPSPDPLPTAQGSRKVGGKGDGGARSEVAPGPQSHIGWTAGNESLCPTGSGGYHGDGNLAPCTHDGKMLRRLLNHLSTRSA